MKPEFIPFRAAKAGASALNGEPQKTDAATARAVGFVPVSHPAPQAPFKSHAHGEPTVTLEREGDRVTLIRVHCPCGNVIELACQY